MKKKIFSLIMVLILLIMTSNVFAAKAVNVTVNGVMVTFDQSPIIVDGRTLVPIRAVAEQIGAEVRWNDSTQTATIIHNRVGVVLQIGNIIMTVRNLDSGVERQVKLDVPPQVYNSRTLLPIRAIMEEFGCKVGWDNVSNTVLITTSAIPQTQKTIVIGE